MKNRIFAQVVSAAAGAWFSAQALSTQAAPAAQAASPALPAAPHDHPLLHCAFTNEQGKIVRLADFHGQALAITFFFTRCPMPNFCPRLSKNFQAASRKLSSMKSGPTNWHFLSVTFDPEFDSPAVLKDYAQQYGADPAHWNFLTGRPDQIRELASLCGIESAKEGGSISHNFRTLIIDASGRLQMSFPIGGDLSEPIVEQILVAAKAGQNPE